jgi:N-acetylmuramoyl-L-alanine amidase
MRVLVHSAALIASLALAATASAQDNGAGPASNDGNCKRASFKVLIDVGHTPDDPGAISAHGNPEYSYNLALADVAMKQLQDAGFRQTSLLMMKGRGYGQLAERAAIANRTSPDLFLSIHHDSTRDPYIRRWQFAGVERNYSDKFSGHSMFVSIRNRRYRDSVAFAKLIGRELLDAGLQYTPQHAEDIPTARKPLLDAELGVYRYDNLVVLKDTRVPAVLFEAGLIINRKDELVLASPERRMLLAKSITNAVAKYCETAVTRPAMPVFRPKPTAARKNGAKRG